jgi:hypothetical protein
MVGVTLRPLYLLENCPMVTRLTRLTRLTTFRYPTLMLLYNRISALH